ncbi:predicted protein [Botrytis cinerea T4]|uniref:Uncharacterized protein n=1 Tax=Botryotinia fuckeliana (strain T4) TaxID=999810 RepID=G2Y534_BOTF4|nr:predicted protein [Botrytis cinerea T4]
MPNFDHTIQPTPKRPGNIMLYSSETSQSEEMSR